MLRRQTWAGCFVAAASAVISIASAQQSAPTSELAKVLSASPTVTPLRVKDRYVGNLKTWRVTDTASALFGLTLCVIEVQRDAVDVSLDGEPRMLGDQVFANFSRPPLLVVNGGPWTGVAGGDWHKRRASGLVIVGQAVIRREEPSWDAGGIFSRCGSDLEILSKNEYDKDVRLLSTNRGVGFVNRCEQPYAAFAIQAKLLLVDGGLVRVPLDRDPPANRVAIGLTPKSVVIVGAFNDSNFALETRDFAALLSAVADKEKLSDLRAINLDGACGAQIYFPSSKFPKLGCNGDNYSVNRFIIKAR